jgi:hypothetical protein
VPLPGKSVARPANRCSQSATLDDPAAGVEDYDLAQEMNLIADYVVNDNLSVGVVGATPFPGDAGEQFTDGDSTWSEVILHASVAF